MNLQKHEQTFNTKSGKFIKFTGTPNGKGQVHLHVQSDMGRIEYMEFVEHLRKKLPDVASLFEMHAPKD